MTPKMIEINGKEYTETEIYQVYAYQKRKFCKEDIDTAIENIMDDPNAVGADILKDPYQHEACAKACYAMLPEWIDQQEEILSNNSATLTMLAENKIREVLKKIEEEINNGERKN